MGYIGIKTLLLWFTGLVLLVKFRVNKLLYVNEYLYLLFIFYQ